MKQLTCTRYVTPLREGGSVPAVVEASDDGLYVLKFRGAAQGIRALVAEIICGELARALGLPMPMTALMTLPAAMTRAEPDPEIQDLLKASVGVNFAIDYLPGSLVHDPAAAPHVDAKLASEIVWFDALITNIDRTAKNTNLLWWHKSLWLIDHGAALYIHHTWQDADTHARSTFAHSAKHVLLPHAAHLDAANARLRPLVTRALLESVVAEVPNDWATADERKAYVDYLVARAEAADGFTEEAARARATRV